MSAPVDDSGPAFPAPRHPSEQQWKEGMTLRDWFAGQALVACAAKWESGMFYETDAAKQAYAMADAMLAVRERKEDSK